MDHIPHQDKEILFAVEIVRIESEDDHELWSIILLENFTRFKSS